MYYSEETILSLAKQGLSTLSYLHSESIIHNTLSLSSFSIDEKLKMVFSPSEKPDKVPYLAPEEVFSKKSDIWAFGCILYDLCTLQQIKPADSEDDTYSEFDSESMQKEGGDKSSSNNSID